MKYIKIYEHPDDNDFKQNADTLYWNSFKNSKCYILYLIDQQSKNLMRLSLLEQRDQLNQYYQKVIH